MAIMAGFELNELLTIVEGELYHELQLPHPIINFEFVPTHLQMGEQGNCFISFSKERWEKVHGIDTKWIDGNERIVEHIDVCDMIITEKPIEVYKETIVQIIVDNSYQAMQVIAEASRKKMKNIVIGITGSVGKSSTRLLLEHVLKEDHDIVATRGNHNTQVGVLLHGTKLCKNPDVGLIEMSINALNNRGNQAKVIQPDICIVTSIGEAHLTTLKTTENIATFKGRIFEGLKENGLAIINRDMKQEEFDILYRAAKKRTNRIKTYSATDQQVDIYLKRVANKKYTTEIECQGQSGSFVFNLDLPSKGTIMNAMAVLLCLGEMGFDIPNLLPEMRSFASLERIMELKQLTTKDDRKIDIIDDSHNAAIPSMINAIETFREKHLFYRGTKILVLGQVADLGEQSATLHDRLLPYILESGADYVFGHSEPMRAIIRKLPTHMVGGWFNNAKDLSRRIPLYCTDDSLILLKGSVSGSDFRITSYILPSQITNSNTTLAN